MLVATCRSVKYRLLVSLFRVHFNYRQSTASDHIVEEFIASMLVFRVAPPVWGFIVHRKSSTFHRTLAHGFDQPAPG